MAIMEILQYPDARLRERAEPVAAVDAAVRAFIDDLFETMYAAPGIGLAATQVGDRRRIVVIDVSPEGDDPRVLINPEIESAAGEQVQEEGCLSIPGVQERVRRLGEVRVHALDRDGAPYHFEADGLLAACVQHEIDHLDGRLFIDHLSLLKRQRIEKRLARERRKGGDEGRKAG